jgi:hypothetical protein
LPESVADGERRLQALEFVETIIQEWIEASLSLGRPIPETKGHLPFASSDFGMFSLQTVPPPGAITATRKFSSPL